MNKELKNKIDDALFNFYLEADKGIIAETLSEAHPNLAEYNKKKKQLMFLAKAKATKQHNDYLLSLVEKFQDAIQKNIEKPIVILKQLLQTNRSVSLYSNFDTLSKEEIIEIIKDKNLIDLLEQLETNGNNQRQP